MTRLLEIEGLDAWHGESQVLRGVSLEIAALPTDARMLSYLVAATVIAETRDRQRFLAETDAAGRLAAEARWLSLEAALLRELIGTRENRRHRPGRGFETVSYRFEIVSDYGAFRDLQRHRLLTCQ